MGKRVKLPGRVESAEIGGIVTGAGEILDDLKGKTQEVINTETDAELLRLDQTKQVNLTFDQTPTENSTNPVTSGGVYAADQLLSQAIEAILLLIPSAASALNKLVDLATMNSSISTATASFKGTYNLVSDLHLGVDATHAQIEAALDALSLNADNNDYAFVQVPNSGTAPTEIKKTERYKFNGTNWAYEYDLNNSGFTAAQWAAINSNITAVLVSKLSALPTNEDLIALLAAKQDVLTFDDSPTSGSNNPVKSGGIYTRNNEIIAMITALDAAKQDVLTFDTTPTENSTNPVTSNGVYQAIYLVQAALAALDGRMLIAEHSIEVLTDDVGVLRTLYQALSQSDIIVGGLPVTGVANTVYRVPGTSTYADWMYYDGAWVKLAEYTTLDGYLYKGIATPSSSPAASADKMFYFALTAGTYTNFGNIIVTEGISILKYDGANWSQDKISYMDGGVFDVTAYSGSSFASLDALLSDANLNNLIPSAVRKGGMSIKFVHTPDNKYVQYQYLGTDVTGTPNPFLRPENWVSVSDIINNIGFDLYQTAQGGGYIANNSVIDVTNIVSDSYFTKHSVTRVVKGQKIHIVGYSGNGPRAYIVTDLNYNALKVSDVNTSIDETITIEKDGYLIVNYDNRVTCSAKYAGNVMSNIGDTYEQINGIYDDLGLDIYNTAQDGYIRNAEVIDITDVVSDSNFTKHSVTRVVKGQKIHIVGYSGNGPRAYIVTDLEYNRIKVSNANTSIDETLNITEDGYLIVNYDNRVTCSAKYVDSVMGNININAENLEETINDIGFDLYRTAQYGGYIADADVIDINSVVADNIFTKHSVTRVLKGQKVHVKGWSGNGPRAWITTDLNYNRIKVCDAGIPVDTDVNILEDGYIVINYDSSIVCSAKFVGSVMSNIVNASNRIEGIIENQAEGHYPIPMVRGKYYTNVIGNVISLTPESDNTSKCACVDCAEGDMFIINAQGGYSPRAFSFLDDERRVIYTCDAGKTYTNEYIIAPEDSRYLLINDLSASKTSYKDWSLREKVDPRKHSEVVNNGYYVAKFANYNKTDHSSIDVMTSAINGAYISQEAMKTQIMLSNPGARIAHDSRLVLKGDKLYCVFVENMVDTGDSAASVNAYVKIAIFNPSTMTKENVFVVAKNGDEVDGLTIISGAGVPNAVEISNGIRCFYTAQLSDNEWYILYRDFITSTSIFDVNKKAKFKVGNETLDFCSTTLNMIDSSFASTMISMNSDIAFDSASGIYYTGVLQLHLVRSGIIVKSDDLDVFELWLEPTFSNEVYGEYEASCAVYDNYLFYALRQVVSRREMVVAKFNLSTKAKTEEIVIVDAGSRPNWIKTDNALYLFHSLNERNRTELLYVYPDSIKYSGIVWNTQNGFVYPSTVLYDNKIYFTYSSGDIILSYLTSLYKYDVKDVTKKVLGIF